MISGVNNMAESNAGSMAAGNYTSNNKKLYENGAIPPFNVKEARILAEKLKIKESYKDALQVLIAWLERGECNDSNSKVFFSLIEMCFDYLKKLKNGLKECLEAVEKAKKNLSSHEDFCIFYQNKMESACKAMQEPEIWDSLSPIQRQNILVFKNTQHTLMDYTNNAVKEESTSLTCGLKEMYEEINDLKKRCEYYENEIKRLRLELKKINMSRKRRNAVEVAFEYPVYSHDHEMLLISQISILLFEYQSGLNSDAIYSYLNMTRRNASREQIEFVLRKFSWLFKEIGLEPEKKWIYIGLGTKK